MNFRSWSVMTVVGLAVLAGCGGDEEEKPAGNLGTPNKQAATSAAQTTITSVQTAIKPNASGNPGQSSANQLAGAAQAAQNVVTPAAGTAAQALFPLEVQTGLRPLAEPMPGSSGKCECTATSCTFAACTMGSVTIDGTYAWGGGKVQCTGLKYTIKSAAGGFGAEVKIDLSCDLTVTATQIDGSFRSKGSTTSNVAGNAYQSDWDTSIDFKGVTFPSGGGAPTGGSQHVEGSITTSIAGAAQTYVASFDVTYPAK